MYRLKEACGKLFAAVINDMNIDILRKRVRFDLTINDGEKQSRCVLEFLNCTSILWLEKDGYAHSSYDFSKCDYYELTSIYFGRICSNSEDDWLSQYPMEYNVTIEIWETALLINASDLSIDNQHFSIPQ